jgi:hypothetical protein
MIAAVLAATLLVDHNVFVVPASAARFDLTPVLSLIKQTPLETLERGRRFYRFFWLPPFSSQRRICVRIEETAAGLELEALAVTSEGRVDAHVKRPLLQAEWDEVAAARESGFWKYKPQEFPQPVADGAYWVIEGQAGGERLRIVQHVPEAGAFRSLGYLMFRLSGITRLPGEESLRER